MDFQCLQERAFSYKPRRPSNDAYEINIREPRLVKLGAGERGVDVLEDLAVFPDTRDAAEALFQSRRFETGDHLLHYVFGNLARAIPIARETNPEGHIEEERLDGTIATLGDFDEITPVFSDKIGRINVGDGAIQVEPDFKQVTQCAKNVCLEALLVLVVGQDDPQLIA